MSKDYEIEQLFIEGLTEKNIAKTLDISVEEVYAWMLLNGVLIDEFSPNVTINS
jgi:phage antirepressor YoqD-like protein